MWHKSKSKSKTSTSRQKCISFMTFEEKKNKPYIFESIRILYKTSKRIDNYYCTDIDQCSS